MTAQDRLARANRVTVDSFTAPDRWYMKRVEKIWARDARTSEWLHELGLPQADFAGNVMMDLLEPELDLKPLLDADGSGRPVLALLPGTRDDYRESLPRMRQRRQHQRKKSRRRQPGDGPGGALIPEREEPPARLQRLVQYTNVCRRFYSCYWSV